jgi:hypothetical protein
MRVQVRIDVVYVERSIFKKQIFLLKTKRILYY